MLTPGHTPVCRQHTFLQLNRPFACPGAWSAAEPVFIRAIPLGLFESMRLDGAGDWGTLWPRAFPLTRPALSRCHLQRTNHLERVPAAVDAHAEPERGDAAAGAGAVVVLGAVQR